MAQKVENELIESMRANPVGWGQKVTNSEPDDAPPIISKKWLCGRFDCQYPAGRFNYRRLHRLVLTAEVISAVGLSPEQVRKPTFREFDAIASSKLKTVLNL